jgi:hypothetical protein
MVNKEFESEFSVDIVRGNDDDLSIAVVEILAIIKMKSQALVLLMSLYREQVLSGLVFHWVHIYS